MIWYSRYKNKLDQLVRNLEVKQSLHEKNMFKYTIFSVVCLFQSTAIAETLLQHEKLSLDKCIKVIEVTSKLGNRADITDNSSSMRVAEYRLQMVY